MPLASLTAGRIAFDKASVMRWAYREGRFAFAMCRTVADRRRQLSIWLRKAWQAAKAQASDLRRNIERAAAVAAFQAQNEREAAALAGCFQNDPAAIRQAIASEHYRDRMNFAGVDRLQAALSHIGA